jgi:hypothetical protein
VGLVRVREPQQSCAAFRVHFWRPVEVIRRENTEGSCLNEDTGLAAGRSSQKPATMRA